MKKFKVCHISTHEGGGAGTAAVRLHAGLMAAGIESDFVCAFGSGKNKNVHTSGQILHPRWKNLLKKLNIDKGLVLEERDKVNQAHGSYDYYSLPFANYAVEAHPKVAEADIINLHWIADFVNYPVFFNTIKKPIVWTFHDMNPFMGGFHYGSDLEKNRNNKAIMDIESRYTKIKKEALSNAGTVEIVTPSKWLYNESAASENTGRFPHHHIPYGLNTSVFRCIPKNIARDIYSLPHDKKIILFVSERLENKRKGFDLLVQAFNGLETEPKDYIIVGVGNDYTANYKFNNFHPTGPVHDERLLSILYSAADVVVIASIEDNLPNVMLESLVCGTPVIAFPVGGMKDTIETGKNGVLCKAISSDALKSAIAGYLNGSPLNSEQIRNDSVKKFDLLVQARNYTNIYERLLS